MFDFNDRTNLRKNSFIKNMVTGVYIFILSFPIKKEAHKMFWNFFNVLSFMFAQYFLYKPIINLAFYHSVNGQKSVTAPVMGRSRLNFSSKLEPIHRTIINPDIWSFDTLNLIIMKTNYEFS